MSQTGPYSWANYYKQQQNVWLSGREIGTGDNLKANLTATSTPMGGGVDTAGGFFLQASRPSPKAPVGAYARLSYDLDFQPQLDEDTQRHVEAVIAAAEFGAPQLWLPWPWRDAWQISTGRVNYTASITISGSAASWPGLHYTPIVEVREPNGEPDVALSYVASSPSSSEFTLDSTTDNSNRIITGDLSAKVGKVLHAWMWGIANIRIAGTPEQGFVEPGEWGTTIPIVTAPPVREYEDD